MMRHSFFGLLALLGLSAALEGQFQRNFLSAEIQTLLDMEVHSSEAVLTLEGKQYFPQANCSRILKEFSSAAANYTLCGASFARPVNLCLQCKGHYLKVKRKYQDMDIYKQDNVTCREVLTKQDKLNIVTSVYNFITDEASIWSLGNCNNCFRDHDPSKEISPEAHTYIRKLQETWNCFNNFANSTSEEKTNLFLKSSHNYTLLCNNCTETYFETRKYFWGTLVPSTKLGDYGAVCIDLKDAFNFTGYMWGIEFRCNSDLEMGGFWILILIPCTFLVLLTYGVPRFIVPRWKGSSHKVLNWLAVPDHYDQPDHDRVLPNLTKFIQTTKKDAEESLSVKAEENLELQDELFKLAEVLQTARSNQFEFADEHERADVLETMTDVLTVLMKKGDHEVKSDKTSVQIPFKEQVLRRRISRRGMSSDHPEIDWKDFGLYVEPERGNYVQSLSVEDPIEL